LSRYIKRSAGALLLGAVALLALYSSAAIAAGPPIVSLESTSEPSLNTTVVNGSVNPNGSPTTYTIEYGKSKLYGQTTTSVNAGNGSSNVPIAEILSGLEPLSTYHARISATNGFGTTTSGDLSWEMLLSWKIEGKLLSSFAKPVEYLGDAYTVPVLTIEGSYVGEPVKYTCQGSSDESKFAHAFLGSSYPMAFENCKVFWGGIEQTGCKPPALINLKLNANAVAEETLTLKNTGASCGLPEAFGLGRPGFALKAMSESQKHLMEFSAKPKIKTTQWTVTVSNSTWLLGGEQIGKPFGIS
jgi:hypothetical protein